MTSVSYQGLRPKHFQTFRFPLKPSSLWLSPGKIETFIKHQEPTSSLGYTLKLPLEVSVPTVGRSPSGRCQLSVASCQHNSWPRGEISVLRSSSFLQFGGGQPHQSRDVRPLRGEEWLLLLKLPVFLLLYRLGVCLKIWGKSGIVQAGAEELKEKSTPKVCWLDLAQTGQK